MDKTLLGIHHITAIAGEPQQNPDFYAGAPGLAASLIQRFPDRLAAAVLLRAMLRFTTETLPDHASVQIRLSAVQTDPVVIPVAITQRLTATLENAGAEVSMHWHAAGHKLFADDVEAARRWFTGESSWQQNAHT